MRDGVRLYADLYRPIDSIAESTPTIVLFAPFGKHGAVPRELFHDMGVDFGRLSPYTRFECPDPFKWCAEFEYSLLFVDARATWHSEVSEFASGRLGSLKLFLESVVTLVCSLSTNISFPLAQGEIAFWFSPEEGRDGYDIVEWIAKQPWYDLISVCHL